MTAVSWAGDGERQRRSIGGVARGDWRNSGGYTLAESQSAPLPFRDDWVAPPVSGSHGDGAAFAATEEHLAAPSLPDDGQPQEIPVSPATPGWRLSHRLFRIFDVFQTDANRPPLFTLSLQIHLLDVMLTINPLYRNYGLATLH
ncbi:hypothetical protein E5D57_012487 [Metarhizium anisopliae]|nr:hypothetical protein E5D57_012487 [Metarhizium anisopliae]